MPHAATSLSRLAVLGAVVGVLALTGCGTPSAPPDFLALSPRISPLDYFTGHASSFGVLESPGGAPTAWFKVESVGAQESGGSLKLDQTIRWSNGKVDHRSWSMRQALDGRLSATLTDASGPVTLEAKGPLLHLSYAMKGIPGSRMEQWLYLQDDAKTLLNEGSVTVLGVLVARISERIGRDGS